MVKIGIAVATNAFGAFLCHRGFERTSADTTRSEVKTYYYFGVDGSGVGNCAVGARLGVDCAQLMGVGFAQLCAQLCAVVGPEWCSVCAVIRAFVRSSGGATHIIYNKRHLKRL